MGFLTFKTEGIVIGKRNLGERDRLITVYTPYSGKIRVVAKGVRVISSRKAGSLETGNRILLTLAKGKWLDIIIEVEILESFLELRKNLKKLGKAFFLFEIADKLTREGEAEPKLYKLILKELRRIERGETENLSFEVEILNLLGFGVPNKIMFLLKENDLANAGKEIRRYLESITEKKIESSELV